MPADGWDRPAPCDGWVARDVVRHLVEWLPAFFCGMWGLALPGGPTVDEDPVAAWAAVDRMIQAALDDPALAGSERDTPMGRKTLEDAIDMICTTDVLIHTWDLARATGQDETLDAERGAPLRRGDGADGRAARARAASTGPGSPVPDDADEQTRLIAFVGRQP